MQVNIYDAKTHLSALVNKALAGEEVIIARDGTPLVTLMPVPVKRRSSMGAFAGQCIIPDDFDAPMPEDWFAS
mgnify:CR=1 FL=1